MSDVAAYLRDAAGIHCRAMFAVVNGAADAIGLGLNHSGACSDAAKDAAPLLKGGAAAEYISMGLYVHFCAACLS